MATLRVVSPDSDTSKYQKTMVGLWLPHTFLRYRHTGRSQLSSRKVLYMGNSTTDGAYCLYEACMASSENGYRKIAISRRKWESTNMMRNKNTNFWEYKNTHAFFRCPILRHNRIWGIKVSTEGFPEFLQRTFLTPHTWMFHTKDAESVCEESKYESRVHRLFSSGIQLSCFDVQRKENTYQKKNRKRKVEFFIS